MSNPLLSSPAHSVHSTLQAGNVPASQQPAQKVADWDSLSQAIDRNSLSDVQALTKQLQLDGVKLPSITGKQSLIDLAAAKAVDTGELAILDHLVTRCGGDIQSLNEATKVSPAAHAMHHAVAQMAEAGYDESRRNAIDQNALKVCLYLIDEGSKRTSSFR